MRALICGVLAVAVLTETGCSTTPDDEPASATPAPVSLTAAPEIAGWTNVNGVLVPLGETDGPTTGSWEPFTGFSHTPQGAALAAIDQSVQLSTASDASWPRVLSVVAASGPGRDQFAVNRALISSTGTVDPTVVPSILGYLITDYSDTRTGVDVVQRFPDASLARTHVTVAWTGTDWKLDLPTTDSAIGATVLTTVPADMVDLQGTTR